MKTLFSITFILIGILCNGQNINSDSLRNIALFNDKRIAHTIDTTLNILRNGTHGERLDTLPVNTRLFFDANWFLIKAANAKQDRFIFNIFFHKRDYLLLQWIENGQPRECFGDCAFWFMPVGLPDILLQIAKNRHKQ